MRGQQVSRKAIRSINPNRFLHEHDWNAVSDRIKNLSILPNKTSIQWFDDGLSRAILELTGSDLLIKPVDE